MPTYQVRLTGQSELVIIVADRVLTESGFVRFTERTDDPTSPTRLVRMFKASTVLEVVDVADLEGDLD